jgi:hypothetical protein
MRPDTKSLLAELEKSNRSSLLYKYLLIIGVIVFIGGLSSWDPVNHTFQLGSIYEHTLAGAVAALLLSIVYDTFTKQEQKVQAEVDRVQLLQELSRELFLTRGLEALTSEDLQNLTKKLTGDDRFLRTLADATVGTSRSFALNILNAYFKPLWRGSSTEFHSWENKLVPDPSNPSGYLWKSRQRSRKSARDIFRVVVTDKATIGAKLVACDIQFDSVLVWNKIDDGTVPDANLIVRVEYTQQDRRRSEGLAATIGAPNSLHLADYLAANELGRIRIFEFRLPEGATQDAVIDCQSTNKLAYDEPFFFVQADFLCFVSEIIIDYSEISSRLNKTWAASFIGNIGTTVEHEEVSHRVIVRVDGALMPGQGVALIWTLAAK